MFWLRSPRLRAGVLLALPVLFLPGCGKQEAPPQPATQLSPSTPEVKKVPETFKVKFETTQGDFVVEVHRDWAPIGVDRFHMLVTSGFYDKAKFFRVLPGFVVQFGLAADPQVTQTAGSNRIADDPVIHSNVKGTLTFATAGPNTRTSQVFINLGNNQRLDGMGFAPFGVVTEGMEIVEQLYSGYGEGSPQGSGPDQGRIRTQGNTYLDANFPLLDSIKKATIF